MSQRHEFVFPPKGMFSPFWTFVWVLCTIYFLWRIGQVIVGVFPMVLLPIPILAIAYMWILRLKPVKAVVVEGDGNVIFDRYWGRREVNAIYIKRVRPWLNLARGGFVLRHADGWELLPGREQTAEVIQELLRFNPEIEVRGIPEVEKHAS